jgi:hypothetical protein
MAGCLAVCGLGGEQTVKTNLPNIPPLFGPDGKPTVEGQRFSTRAYEREALRLVLQEANAVARDLQLPEQLPILPADLIYSLAIPFGRSRTTNKGKVGVVDTRDYIYAVTADFKLSDVGSKHSDENLVRWRNEYVWPIDRLETNKIYAYQLATQWLSAAKMDVEALTRDCQLNILLDEGANFKSRLKEHKFTPLYSVGWLRQTSISPRPLPAATVKVFTPTKQLIHLTVFDGKYILRPAVQFTNLDELLSDPNRR